MKRDLEGLFESVAALIDGYGNELLQFTDIGRRCRPSLHQYAGIV